MKNSFDRIIASTPVDKTAAIVARGKGEHWDVKVGEQYVHSSAPLRTVPFPQSKISQGEIDLTGLVIGRLTVTGFHGFDRKGNTRWVVRCVCGMYELRRRRALTRSKKPERQMCRRCDKSWLIRQPEYQSGKWSGDR